jgi:hypothetical protein
VGVLVNLLVVMIRQIFSSKIRLLRDVRVRDERTAWSGWGGAIGAGARSDVAGAW